MAGRRAGTPCPLALPGVTVPDAGSLRSHFSAERFGDVFAKHMGDTLGKGGKKVKDMDGLEDAFFSGGEAAKVDPAAEKAKKKEEKPRKALKKAFIGHSTCTTPQTPRERPPQL